MSQQPPTGSPGEPGASDDDAPRTPRTPDEAGGEATESFARSPYDVPETQPMDGTTAYPAASYGQAPDPNRATFSQSSTLEEEPEPEDGRPRWVVPVVIAVIVLLVAGGIAAALLLGGDDEDDPAAPVTPSATAQTTDAEATTAPEESLAPTDEPTTAPTTPAATEEPTDPATGESPSELREDLDEAVSVGDLTFELSEDGFAPEEDVDGAVEAWRGSYVSGDEQIDMFATYWPDNESADEFAASIVENVDGEQVETGHTYTNETGTFWAFLLEDGRGSYVWTTDRGHVLQVTGSTDYVGGFYSSFPL